MAGLQIARRVPSIKFPNRRAPSPCAAQTSMKPLVPPANPGSAGTASIQPKRPPVSKEEIEAVLLGGVA